MVWERQQNIDSVISLQRQIIDKIKLLEEAR